MINFWKLAYKSVKEQLDQHKKENEQLREQFDYMNQSYMKLYEENEKLKKEKKVNRTKASLLTGIEMLKEENEKLERENEKYSEHIRELQAQQGSREYTKVLEKENLEYFKENKALRLQADTYFEEWQNEKLKREN